MLGYGSAVSETGNPISPEEDEGEATEAADDTADNPDVDDE